jgi:uncharacterized protein YndB with AHSA1/START domain
MPPDTFGPVFDPERDLRPGREIAAPLERVWRCLTEARHLAQWWVPAPVRLAEMILEPQPGGRFSSVLTLDDGSEVPMAMMILDARDHVLRFTDLMTAGFRPVAEPFLGFLGELRLTATLHRHRPPWPQRDGPAPCRPRLCRGLGRGGRSTRGLCHPFSSVLGRLT